MGNKMFDAEEKYGCLIGRPKEKIRKQLPVAEAPKKKIAPIDPQEAERKKKKLKELKRRVDEPERDPNITLNPRHVDEIAKGEGDPVRIS